MSVFQETCIQTPSFQLLADLIDVQLMVDFVDLRLKVVWLWLLFGRQVSGVDPDPGRIFWIPLD